MALGDELYERINCYGIGGWLDGFLIRMGQALPTSLQAGKEVSLGRFRALC